MRVFSWNVLHRVHAVNWNETPVSAFPDERVRIAGITELIAGWLDAQVDGDGDADERVVVCLQEVSGDQLASLRRALPRFDIHTHCYPRVPRVRGSEEAILDDPTEHLVTITRAPSKKIEAITYESDAGKGLLVVSVTDDVCVIDTHVSFGERAAAQLDVLAAAAGRHGTRAVIVGDFNAPVETIRAGLGPAIRLSDLSGQRPTRIATSQHGGKTIDHVAVVGGAPEDATVLDGRLVSDHNPVTARIHFE